MTAAVQQLPPKRNRRVYLADVLKNTALQSLMVAASVCNEANVNLPLASEYAAPLQGLAPLSNYAAPLPRRNLVVAAPSEAPLLANRELLSALLPRELLSSLVGRAQQYAPSRPMSFQVV